MIEIIKADLSTPQHATALIDLLNVYATDIMGGGQELSGFTKSNLAAELHKRENIHTFFAYENQTPIALAICIEGFSTFACQPLMNIHDVIVTAEHRGKGIVAKLLQVIETHSKSLGCCKLTLEVLEGNIAAQKAYLKFGFAGYELDPNSGKALFWEKKL